MTATIISAATLLILLAFGWAMPALAQPTIPFGVRVPPDRVTDPRIARIRRGYRAALLVSFVIIFGITLAVIHATGVLWLSEGCALAAIAAYISAYYVAHSRLRAIKTREQWYIGQHEVVMANVAVHAERVGFPVVWLAPALAILAATFIIGIMRYSKLPATIPTHFNLNGKPNGFAPKMPAAFLLAGMEVVITLIFIALAWFIPRLRYDVDPADPQASTARQRIFRLRWSRALLLFAALTNVSMLMGSLLIWQALPADRPLTMVASLAPAALLLLGAFGLAVVTGQNGARERVAASGEQTGYVHRDDDRFWKAGLIYYNPDDPALLVERRFGVGWTLNLARKSAWALLGGTLLLIVGAVLLPRL